MNPLVDPVDRCCHVVVSWPMTLNFDLSIRWLGSFWIPISLCYTFGQTNHLARKYLHCDGYPSWKMNTIVWMNDRLGSLTGYSPIDHQWPLYYWRWSFWSYLKMTEEPVFVCLHARKSNHRPSASRFRFVSVLSVVFSLGCALSASRDRFVDFELLFSGSVLFFSDAVNVWRLDFLSIEGVGLESSSRMTHGGEGGKAEAVFSVSLAGTGVVFTDTSGIGESWTTSGVDWCAPK